MVLVATKSDKFVAIRSLKALQLIRSQGRSHPWDEVEKLVQGKLAERIEEIQEQILGVEYARYDACVAVSKGKLLRFIRQIS